MNAVLRDLLIQQLTPCIPRNQPWKQTRAASVQADVIEAEKLKPADGSDLTSHEAAMAELIRLRKIIRDVKEQVS